MEPGKNMNAQNPEFIKARRKLDRYAFDRTLEEYKKDNTIDFQKRKEEIIKEELLELKRKMQEREEKDLLSGINKLVDKNSDIPARYNEWASKEADEKQAIREEADRILEELKKEQREKEKQAKNVKPSVLNRNDEIKKKIEEAKQAKKLEDMQATKRRAEALRRANCSEAIKRYEDRQEKLTNFVKQLASINEMENKHVQNNRTSSIKRTQVQNQNVSSSNIRSETSIPERVVIKETEPAPNREEKTAPIPKEEEKFTPKTEEKTVQETALTTQKLSLIEHFQKWGKKVADKFSEATITAYEMLTFKHNRDVAVGKRKERTVSPAEASNAYEKNMNYIEYDNSKPNFDVRSKNGNKNKTTPFLKHLQAKADEKAAINAMNSKSKNEQSRDSEQRGA